ncbi:hypothetical protein A6C57_10895 [Fibrella sp. ES10-3-2-2]|nr:hypothetical protein A6C57_10895 [Fibrella sp. ES10-3-2-2]
MTRAKWTPLLVLLVILTSCQRANEKGREVLVACLEKAKKKGSRAMQSGAEAIAGKLTTTRKFSFQACFGETEPPFLTGVGWPSN